MRVKPKMAFYWCSGCGGCEESILDLAGSLADLLARVDVVFWPVAFDYDYADLERLADGEILASFINGAIRTEDHAEKARLLRRKSRYVVSHGACAQTGGVVGLGNFFTTEEIVARLYRESPTVANPAGIVPRETSIDGGHELHLPPLCPSVKPLNGVIDVDYYVPGCPPTPELMQAALTLVIEGMLPAKGSVLAEKRSLCDTCARRDSKPEKLTVARFRRLTDTAIDPATCFLAQEIICLGPATRGGCRDRCIGANMPCRGCFGPPDGVTDQGARAISFIASLIGSNDPAEIAHAIGTIPDPAGLFYRYTLAASTLRGRAQGRTDG